MKRFIPPSLRYDRERIFTRLRIRPDRESVYEYAAEIFPRLERIAAEEAELLCGYTLAPLDRAAGIPLSDGCEGLAVCFVCCSNRIEEKIKAMIAEGELLEGYILNDLANDILFSASDDMNCRLREELHRQDCGMTERLTPGEGSLTLAQQQTLLDILKAKYPELPLTLTERCMLQPERSMLYAYGFGRQLPDRPVDHDCSRCTNESCYYRSRT